MKTVSQLDAMGYFVGSVIADKSPLEDGVFLVPGGAVDFPPVHVPEGFKAKWNGTGFDMELINVPAVEPVEPVEPEPPPVLSCTPWQIRKKLNKEGLRDAVESYVKSEQATQDEKDAWEFATKFREDNPLLMNAAAMLGITDLHAFIEDAQTL